jgi:hypothetical protein
VLLLLALRLLEILQPDPLALRTLGLLPLPSLALGALTRLSLSLLERLSLGLLPGLALSLLACESLALSLLPGGPLGLTRCDLGLVVLLELIPPVRQLVPLALPLGGLHLRHWSLLPATEPLGQLALPLARAAVVVALPRREVPLLHRHRLERLIVW